ncbi:MAG: KpsF/GutQ family sugar-phosphate isomerase [Burkholderiaceae bacterium]|nr:KpsF/GutQ family sugar-phosphate isomerase [Burkholderiaceae bacterium]
MKDCISTEEGILQLGKEVLLAESSAVANLAETLSTPFVKAVNLLLGCKGRIVVSGVGKSGHIARKIAATLASTGSPAFFVHAAEAAHGDLGMITPNDVVIAISYSGSSSELLTIIPSVIREGASVISITGSEHNPLADHATVNLNVHIEREACPLNLAPTSSTTATLAIGDALAVACLDAKGFGPDDFARSHPGGALGRRLLTRVEDIMRKGEKLPSIPVTASVLDAVKEITAKKIGMTAIVDNENCVVGIFTEGDLRRLIEKVGDIRQISIADVMTKDPTTTTASALAIEAAKTLEQTLLNQLLVIDQDRHLIGALHIHDLMTAKVI